MAKFHGYLGFSTVAETADGVYKETFVEKEYTGTYLRANQRFQTGEKVNKDLSLSTRISVLVDPLAFVNIANIKYVKIGAVKWEVTTIESEPPRLIFTIGSVYNG